MGDVLIEIAVVRREALYKGETGLFPVDLHADEEVKRLPRDETAWAEITTPRNIKLLRYLWAIAGKLADGGVFQDKDTAMTQLKIMARFAEFEVKGNRVVIVPRSLSRQRADVLSRLADRIVFIVCNDLIPGMKESEFRKEIEDMVS